MLNLEAITVIANLFTIIASGIAIYLFFWKGKAISGIFRILLNYSFQITLSELNGKLDRLNDINASEDKEKAINVFHEIIGQIRGNRRLRVQCADVLKKIEAISANSKRLKDAQKRSIICELRENIRHINIENIDDLMGGQ